MDGIRTTDPREAGFRPLEAFREADAMRHWGSQLVEIRRAAPRFRDAVKASGKATFVRTAPLKSLPYPTQFGFFRARTPTTPFLTITNQMIVVRYRDLAGASRVLLFSPSDHELGRSTPFFAQLSKRLAASVYFMDVTPAGGERVIDRETGQQYYKFTITGRLAY